MFNEWSGNDTFFEAMQIHAVCLDAKLDHDIIRLLTYMHFKIKLNDNNTGYFDQPSEEDCNSIEIMLGDTKSLESTVSKDKKNGVYDAFIMDHSRETAESIRKLDVEFRNSHGMENRISGELKDRLRLYRDEEFRNEMLQLYKNTIVPRMDLYEMPTINRAFRQARERETLAE